MRQKKGKFRKQEHRSFNDWFISVPAKITRSGHHAELKMYEHHFYKADWEELDRFIKAAEKQRKEVNMRTNTRVYGRGTFR